MSFGLEATLSNPDSDIQLCQEFKQAGYETQVHVVAVPKEISSISVTTRYLHGREQTENRDGYIIHKGRHVPSHIQQSQYDNLPRSVERLASSKHAVDTIGIYDRDGNELIVVHGKDIDSQSIARTLESGRKLENTSLRQLETALVNHEYNQTQNLLIQAQPSHTPAVQAEQKTLAIDIKHELTHAKNIEKALPVVRKKELVKERDKRIHKRLKENKTKNQTHTTEAEADKTSQTHMYIYFIIMV